MVAWPVPQVYGMAGYSKVHNAIAFSIGRVSDITMQLAVVAVLCKIPQRSLKTRKNCASDRKSCVNANVQCHSGAGSR